MKLLKSNGAKDLAYLVSDFITTVKGMIDYYETKSQPITSVSALGIDTSIKFYTFVIK